jgi:secondary thiamine-phosphate synthase enzyme
VLKKFELKTNRENELVNITRIVQDTVAESGAQSGLCFVYSPHTTAGINVNEGADPDVVLDILMELDKIVPLRDGYRHFEGNSAAHIKSSLFNAGAEFIIDGGKLLLGQWQAIYFCEFDGPRKRSVYIKVLGGANISEEDGGHNG